MSLTSSCKLILSGAKNDNAFLLRQFILIDFFMLEPCELHITCYWKGEPMSDYDFYLRHASIRDEAWVGFRLAWRGLAGVDGLAARPHLRSRPWQPDPADPSDVSAGTWGSWQWHLDAALLDAIPGLQSTPPADGRDAADMRADLLAFADLPAIQLTDVDSVVYAVRVVGYGEQNIEPYNSAHPDGGWVAQVVLQQV
jgi:hypothetical protein